MTRVGETQPRPVDFRLVSATNAPVYDRLADGSFRQDLLYRINTVELHLPPLRERGDDVRLLAEHFLQHYAGQYGRAGLRFAGEAFRAMATHAWPGNVRELQHAVERAVILTDGSEIGSGDLPFAPVDASSSSPAPPADTLDLSDIERAAVRRALSEYGGNISQAARALGLTRKSLYRRIEKYGL